MLTRMRSGVSPRHCGLGLDDGDPHDGIWTSSPVLCGINSRDGWVVSHVHLSTGNKARSGYKREVMRSDGEAAMVRS